MRSSRDREGGKGGEMEKEGVRKRNFIVLWKRRELFSVPINGGRSLLQRVYLDSLPHYIRLASQISLRQEPLIGFYKELQRQPLSGKELILLSASFPNNL